MKKYICDCCKKEANTVKVKIPIMLHTDTEDGHPERYMAIRKIDLCQDCCREIMKTYYDTAQKNGNSGLHCFE